MDKMPSLEETNHFITRDEARKLISNYERMSPGLLNEKFAEQHKKYGILPKSEAFNEKSILSILAQPGCVGIRIHYGIKLQEQAGEMIPLLVSVIVGVSTDGSNMWARAAAVAAQPIMMSVTSRDAGDDGVILEDSQRCPPFGDSAPLP